MPDRVATGTSADVESDSFPDHNPHPVLRVTLGGTLEYANAASEPILRRLGVALGERVPREFLARVKEGARATPPQPFELDCELRTFAILSVPVPSAKALNIYGTDITAAKVVEEFPDRNPNPVLRIRPDGTLLYANTASRIITTALDLAVGRPIPPDLQRQIRSRMASERSESIEVRGDGRIFDLNPVEIPEFDFINLYGTDVTAQHAITKFPDENPNPVLRVTRAGRLAYSNPASALVREGLKIAVGDPLPPKLLNRIRAITDGRAADVIQLEHGGRVFELRVVGVFEFESINIYGTDVTAARQIERANQENERLLLNIFPASIAERLRRGEEPIADTFDEIAVLFADVVDFTPYSASRSASEVVVVLNQIFSLFDRLADRHRLEKIKTVGDAYMVVGGIAADGGGAHAVADMALDMVGEMHRYRTDAGVQMQIRVGLHIGPGIGGVIGLKRFLYDFWGDTVNTASRLEGSGEPGRIQVMTDTAMRLGDTYLFERRRVVEMKGKGEVEVCFLAGRR